MATISIHDLSKRYHRALPDHGKLDTFGEALIGAFKRPLQYLRQSGRKQSGDDFFWALRDIELEMHPGEVVGIIGANGAGKSTLLKILSRITEPTTGQVILRGRLASLLEVGTGFHPQLTGRENIFLNGAILGMKRKEIRDKFDEIVAFSEIEDFLDTPVKHYSSGMYVRLAFAVAAHLDPEILVVDEVLAVGDYAFQRKCLAKMREVGREGRTILFVSHNMAALENLCTRGVVLERGRMVFNGAASDAIRQYLHAAQGTVRGPDATDLTTARRNIPGQRPRMTALHLFTEDDRPVRGVLQAGASLVLRLSFRLDEPGPVGGGFGFETLLGQRVFRVHTMCSSESLRVSCEGEYVLTCRIPSLTLGPGEYRINVGLLLEGADLEIIDDAYRLTIVESDYFGTGKLPGGLVLMPHDWSLEPAATNAVRALATAECDLTI
jgi:lipopolysaccharide transport system ATP-binding protein